MCSTDHTLSPLIKTSPSVSQLSVSILKVIPEVAASGDRQHRLLRIRTSLLKVLVTNHVSCISAVQLPAIVLDY